MQLFVWVLLTLTATVLTHVHSWYYVRMLVED